MKTENVVEMKNIVKSFVGVPVLRDVSIGVKPGEVRALLGENGAGKSTLIKILGGIIPCDSGEIWMNGKKAEITNVMDAKALGIAIIHQEIALVDSLSVAENIFMGREYVTKSGMVDFKRMNGEARAILDSLSLQSVEPTTLIEKLSVSKQQLVEIAKAVSTNASVIVMDEPTASLTDNEVDHLFAQIEKLKKSNVAIVYISHKLDEIFKIADSITILRDGKHIVTEPVENLDYPTVIKHMVGRELNSFYAKEKLDIGGNLLEVRNLTTDSVEDISFDLKKGEILSITGLVGAGRTELISAIFGLDPIRSGEIRLNGNKISIKSPGDAIGHGLALVPEERKRQGLVLNNTIKFNMTLPIVEDFIKFIYVDKAKENNIIERFINSLSIKMSSPEQLAAELSGGNQQKVVISKWLAKEPVILIMDEPTRGIDVGSKSEIYHLMDKIALSGVSIIMVSSELPEVLNVSSRIMVMHEGKLVHVFDNVNEEVSQESIMYYATGGN